LILDIRIVLNMKSTLTQLFILAVAGTVALATNRLERVELVDDTARQVSNDWEPPAPLRYIKGHECFMILAGKDATVDGSVMAAHNLELTGTEVSLIEKHPQAHYEKGDTFEFPNGLSIPRGESASEWMVLRIQRSLDSNAVGMNEHQVALAGGLNLMGDRNPRAMKADPRVPGGVSGLARNIALLDAQTAREAARKLGDLYTRYGSSYQCGVGYADPNEAWYVESGGGRTWAAVRVPDDEYWVQANAYRIGEIDPKDERNVLTSPGLLEFAEEHGLWDPEEGPFSFRRAFGQKSRGLRYNEVREWRAMDVLSPSLALEKKGTEFPMTVKPDRKIALEDLFGILRDREPLVTLNANAPNTNTVTIKIGSDRVIHSNVIQLRSEMPAELGSVLWSSLSAPHASIYLPFYFGVDRLPEAYAIPSPRERAAHFAFKGVQRALDGNDPDAGRRVSELRAFEKSLLKQQATVEAGLSKSLEEDHALGIQSLTDHVHEVAGQAFSIAR
jgi:dipeptidase